MILAAVWDMPAREPVTPIWAQMAALACSLCYSWPYQEGMASRPWCHSLCLTLPLPRQLPLLLSVVMAALTLGRLLPEVPALLLDVQPFSIRDCEGSQL